MNITIKAKIFSVLSILFALMFINSGLNKFLNYMPMPPMPEEATKAFDAMMQIGWLMPLVGIVEIVAGLMIIIPKTRALGALMMVPIMVGIIGSNTFTNISGLPIALVFTIVLLWILVEEKDRLLPIIK